MGIATVVATSARTSDGKTMNFTGMNTTGANALALAVITNNWTLSKTITDSKGNSYLDSGAGWLIGGGSNYGVQLLYCLNPTVGSSHDLTIAYGSLCFPAAFFLAISGAKTSSAPTYATNAGGSSQTSWSVSLTPAAANSMIFTAIENGVGGAASLPSGYTGTSYPLNTSVDPYSVGGAYAYKIQSGGPAPETPTFTWTGSSTVSAGALIFAPAPDPVTGTVGASAQAATASLGGQTIPRTTGTLEATAQAVTAALSGQVIAQVLGTLAAEAGSASASLAGYVFPSFRAGRFRGRTLPRDTSPWGVNPRRNRTIN